MTDSMIVIACGSRSYTDRARLDATLDEIHERTPIEALVDGAARGADTLAHEWALRRGITTRRYPADWSTGRSAGPRRNRRMADAELLCELVVAFVDQPFAMSRGTADMIDVARARHLPYVVIGDPAHLHGVPDPLPAPDPNRPAKTWAQASFF